MRRFLIPIIERLLRLEAPIKKHHVGAIIISPTRYYFLSLSIKDEWLTLLRELATQIHTVLLSVLAFHAPSAIALNKDDDEASEMGESTPPPVFPSSTLKVLP